MAKGTKSRSWEKLKSTATTQQKNSNKTTSWEELKESAYTQPNAGQQVYPTTGLDKKTRNSSWEELKKAGQHQVLIGAISDIEKGINAEIDAFKNFRPTYGAYDEVFESQKGSRANISALRTQVEQYRGYMDPASVEQILATLDQLDQGYDALLELTKNNGVIMRTPEQVQQELDQVNSELEQLSGTYHSPTVAKAIVTPSDLDVDVPMLGPEIVDPAAQAVKKDAESFRTLEQRRATLESELKDAQEWKAYCERSQRFYDEWGHYADEDWFAEAAAYREYVNPTDEDLQIYDVMMDNFQWESRGDGTGAMVDPFGNVIPMPTDGSEYVHPMRDDPRYAIQDPLGMFKAASEDDLLDALATNQDRRGTRGAKNDILAEGCYNNWDQITKEEEDLYYAVLKTEGVDRALEFLRATTELRNSRWGMQEVQRIKNLESGFWRVAETAGLAITAGMDSWGTGVVQAFSSQALPNSGLQYANAEMSGSLTGLYKDAYNATYSAGRMLPSIVFTKLLGVGGAGEGFLKGAGALSTGISIGGNAYGQALKEGYSKEQARSYGVLVGASEAVVGYLIGGITELGGVGTEQPLKKLEVIDNSLLRISAKLAVKTGSEIFEEGLQNYLEPAIRTILFEEEYDAPTAEEMLETAVTTALSTLMLEGSSTAADDLVSHNAPFTDVSSYPAGHIPAVDTEFQKYYDSIIQMEGDVYGEGQTGYRDDRGLSPGGDAQRRTQVPGDGTQNGRILSQQGISKGEGGSVVYDPGDRASGTRINYNDGFDRYDGSITRDNQGKEISQEVVQQLLGTTVLDATGKPMPVYHGTADMEFTEFRKGDTGFHFGTLEQAQKRIGDKQVSRGRVLQGYVVIRNPIVSETDIGRWDAEPLSMYLVSKGLISDAEYREIQSLLTGDAKCDREYNAPAAVRLREILDNKGYDGVIYSNFFEGDALSYMVFHDSQFIRKGISEYNTQNDTRSGALTSREALAWVLENKELQKIDPRTRSLLQKYGKHLQQLQTIERLQSQLQPTSTDANTSQLAGRNLAKLEQLYARHAQRLAELEKNPRLQNLAQQTLTELAPTEPENVENSQNEDVDIIRTYDRIKNDEIHSEAETDGVVVIELSRTRYPQSAQHILDAVSGGMAEILTIDREHAKENRRRALAGMEKSSEYDLDEYPPAMFKEGGEGASVRQISPSDNRGAGSVIGHQLRGYPDGTKIKIKIVD